MEALLMKLLTAAGFNAAAFAQGIQGFIGTVQSSIASFDKRLTNIETAALSIDAKTTRILDAIEGSPPGIGSILDRPPAPDLNGNIAPDETVAQLKLAIADQAA